MNKAIKSTLILAIAILSSLAMNAQARLTIENNSQRSLTIKVMECYGGKGKIHKTAVISANGSETIYFSESGYYFTKTKAILKGKEPVYQKGQPFQVTNNSSGYSVLNLTFTIRETTVPQVLGGKQISKSEFDQN